MFHFMRKYYGGRVGQTESDLDDSVDDLLLVNF